jgi:hypothetical protein
VVGEQTVAYYSMTLDTFHKVIPQATIFECFALVEGGLEEWVLGDSEGRLYSLSIHHDGFIFTTLGSVGPSLPLPKSHSQS